MGLNEHSDTSDNHEGTVAYSVQDSEETRYSMQENSRTLLSPSWFYNAFRYSMVNEDDLEPDAPMQVPRMRRELERRRRSVWIWRSVAALFAMVLLLVEVKNYGILATADVTSSTVHDVHMQCGDTTRSAIARGCQFHPLSNRWLPGRCRIDRSEAAIASALNTDLEEKQPFKVWLDPAGKTEITDVSELIIAPLLTCLTTNSWISCCSGANSRLEL